MNNNEKTWTWYTGTALEIIHKVLSEIAAITWEDSLPSIKYTPPERYWSLDFYTDFDEQIDYIIHAKAEESFEEGEQ